MKLFKPHESYIIRHEILKVLFDSAQSEKDEQRPKVRVSLSQVAQKTGIDEKKLFLYHELLHEKDEINCNYDCSDPKDHYMLIETEGRQSYIYEKYLKEGKLEAKNEMKDKVAIFAPLASFIVAIFSLVLAIMSYSKSITNQESIKKNEDIKGKNEIQYSPPVIKQGH